MAKPRIDSDVVPVSVRLPRELYEVILAGAGRNRRSLTQEVIARLEVLEELQGDVAELDEQTLRLRLAPFASAQ